MRITRNITRTEKIQPESCSDWQKGMKITPQLWKSTDRPKKFYLLRRGWTGHRLVGLFTILSHDASHDTSCGVNWSVYYRASITVRLIILLFPAIAPLADELCVQWPYVVSGKLEDQVLHRSLTRTAIFPSRGDFDLSFQRRSLHTIIAKELSILILKLIMLFKGTIYSSRGFIYDNEYFIKWPTSQWVANRCTARH